MTATSPILDADAFRRQVLLEGVKTGEFKKLSKFLKEMLVDITDRLNKEGETIETKKRLNILLADMNAIQKDVYTELTGQLVLDLDDISLMSADLEADSLSAVVQGFESVRPAPEQIIQAYQNAPLSLTGKSGGFTLKPFLKDYTVDQVAIINGTISRGYAEGRTISQIVKDIQGTKSLKFKDGKAIQISRHTRTMVRTAVQNASSQAKIRVWDSNKDLVKGRQLIAVLDSRTTPRCRDEDGNTYPLDSGPVPPLHPGCRTTESPVLSETFDFLEKGGMRPINMADGPEQVGSKATYYPELKKQPASFQNEVLGIKRGQLFRNGGMSIDQFKSLQLDRNFKERSIEEMRVAASNSQVEAIRNSFEQANLE